jgi:RimJ/RimL family protein N-acetyltransferase
VKVLRTERLELREPAERDVPQIVAGCSEPDVPRYIPFIPAPYTERDAREWLAGSVSRRRSVGEHSFAVVWRGADELLGVVSIRLRPGGSLGYWLRVEARGRGVMSEAVAGVVRWAGSEHAVRDLFITAHPDNVASQQVAVRAGFVRDGLVDHDPPFADGTRLAVRFSQRSS